VVENLTVEGQREAATAGTKGLVRSRSTHDSQACGSDATEGTQRDPIRIGAAMAHAEKEIREATFSAKLRHNPAHVAPPLGGS
jgi:hypothetical protein